MKTLTFIVISLALISETTAQNNYTETTKCDSTLSLHRTSKDRIWKLGDKPITAKEAFKILYSHKASADEMRKAKKITGIGLALFTATIVTAAIPSVVCAPLFFGWITYFVIKTRNSNGHFLKSIKVYNQEVCNNYRDSKTEVYHSNSSNDY